MSLELSWTTFQQDGHLRAVSLLHLSGSEQAKKVEKGVQRLAQRASAGARRSLSSRGAKLVSVLPVRVQCVLYALPV
jgi:hypothetical protein